MKLITLNIWGGKLHEQLVQFVEQRGREVDVVCFQEVFHTPTDRTTSNEARANSFSELTRALPDFRGAFHGAQDGFDPRGAVNFELSYGLATFVRSNIPVEEHGDEFVYRFKNSRQEDHRTIGRNVEFTLFSRGADRYAICNFHGLWNGTGKTDTPDRLEQSRKVLEVLDRFRDRKLILCGDFNLLPNTRSLAMLERGMRNLIKESGATSTRSSHYTKPEKFADYILVSPNVNVRHFEVLKDEVSDHLPLLLEFD